MPDKWPLLKNAPITEAVIELQFGEDSKVSLDVIEKVLKNLKPDFPLQNEKRNSIIRANIKESGAETEVYDEGVVGYVARSKDGKKVITLLKDRFAFSQLAPYSRWEVLESDALLVWNVFVEIAEVNFIGRVGLRFINRIELELPFEDFSDFLVSAPIVPEGLPQGFMNFEQRVVIPNPEIRAIAIVNQSMESFRAESKVVSVVLDIDVGKRIESELEIEELQKILSTLRDYKNEVFFRNITEKVVEMYQ